MIKGIVGTTATLVLAGEDDLAEKIKEHFPKYNPTDNKLSTPFDSAVYTEYKKDIGVVDDFTADNNKVAVIKDVPFKPKTVNTSGSGTTPVATPAGTGTENDIGLTNASGEEVVAMVEGAV